MDKNIYDNIYIHVHVHNKVHFSSPWICMYMFSYVIADICTYHRREAEKFGIRNSVHGIPRTRELPPIGMP
jgi:hypothetical protein